MAGTFITSADACDREAAWLSLPGTVADGLPSLLVMDGGPWDVIQAYQPRTPAVRKAQVFVTRTDLSLERFGFILIILFLYTGIIHRVLIPILDFFIQLFLGISIF